MPDGAQLYREAFIEALQPPVDLTVSQFADAERILTRRSCSEPGPWRTDRVPFLREPMDLLSPREKRIKRVVLIFGSQSGAKTECGLNWTARSIAMDPAPMLIMFPTEPFAKRQYQQRLRPLFEDTPAVAAKALSSKSRDSANAMFLKEFQGDMLISIVGSNSGSAAQGMPAQYFWADEVSSFPMEMDDKGDPLENAEARQTNFPDRKTLLTSTPGTRGACRITWEYEERSDRRRYLALMPCCGEREFLEWKDFVWNTSDSEVLCKCPACNELVAQHHKGTMLGGGRWMATAKGDGETAGFHLPGWYAPYGWLSWEKIRDEFLRAKSDVNLLKGWKNKRAAEAWEDEALAKVSADGLIVRAGEYQAGTCPAGVLVLLMSVDVQDTWLEVVVKGYGRGDESWRVWHQKIEGDPAQSDVWDQVLTVLRTEFPREGGGTMRVRLCAVDTQGHYTPEAYNWARENTNEGVVAIKGANKRDAPALSKGSKIDVTFRGKTISNGLTLYMVGGHGLKRTVYSRLKIEQPGPGYVHFDDETTEEYLAGLTAERLQPRYVKGFQVLEWHCPSGARNEPLDCEVYCLAMLELLKRRYNRATMWDQLERLSEAAARGGSKAATASGKTEGNAFAGVSRFTR